MSPAGPRSRALLERAAAVIPGGVSSPVRAFRAVGGDPFFVAEASGAYVTDVDGRRYVDYVQSWGASILGHAHADVVAAVQAAAGRGTTFGAPTEGEVRLVEAVVAAVPGCDMVRLVSSGTEAAMTAVRVARGATGRHRVVTFAGCYHGHSDALLAAGGSGVATLGLSGSAGVPPSAVADTIVAPYNVVPALDERVACVLVEPVAANMGLVPPAPGFLEGLRRACDEAGALLVFDEVITGFRLGRGGAASRFGVRPDLWCFGKVVGGGLPLAAVGGREDLMEQLAPVGPVYQAGTLSGNPLATAAGLAVLERLDDALYAGIERRVAELADGLRSLAAAAGVPLQVPVEGTLLGVFFGERAVADYDGAKAAAALGRYPAYFSAMAAGGVSLAPSPYEILFVSAAHGDDEVAATLEAAEQALAGLPSVREVGAAG